MEVNDKRGIIDKTGKYLIEPKFDAISEFSEWLALVDLNKKSGYIDETGKVVIEIKFDRAGIFNQGLAIVGMKKRPLTRVAWVSFPGSRSPVFT